MQKSASSDQSGIRAFGKPSWEVLKSRLGSLLAAPTLSDLDKVPGNCHQLSGNRSGQFAMNLKGPHRLVFKPDHSPVPRLPDGGIDRSLVTDIVILEMVDYHAD